LGTPGWGSGPDLRRRARDSGPGSPPRTPARWGGGPEPRADDQPESIAHPHRERRLRRGQTRDRYAIGRTADVVQPDLLEEMDRGRIAAMLTADAQLDARTRAAAELHGRSHDRSHALGVEGRKRILIEDLLVLVDAQELADIIA